MTNQELLACWRNPNHLWQSTKDDEAAERLRREDLKQVKRRISYFLNGGKDGLQFWPVEGWTTQAILDYMERGGISRSQIDRKLATGEGAMGERWRAAPRKSEDKRGRGGTNTSSPTDSAASWAAEDWVAAVRVYLELCRFLAAGVRFSVPDQLRRAREGVLGRHSVAMIERQMQCIAATVRERGLNPPSLFSSAANVDEATRTIIEAAFRSVGLALETLVEPTGDPVELTQRTHDLLRHGLASSPKGQLQPEKRSITTTQYLRDAPVKAAVLARAKGRCEACDDSAPFCDENGDPFLEVHHVHSLAEGGPDTVTNAVAVCPNCHRRFHHSKDRADYRDKLYLKLIGTLVRT